MGKVKCAGERQKNNSEGKVKCAGERQKNNSGIFAKVPAKDVPVKICSKSSLALIKFVDESGASISWGIINAGGHAHKGLKQLVRRYENLTITIMV